MEYMTGSYEGFKKETDLAVEKIRTGAMTMAQGAVELGYQLKVARDTGILKESGYTTMSEFAKEEYGIRPDQATRYIQINDKYSENGYSRMLKGKYAGIGVSLLVDMLQLPDTVRDEITQKFSREDIRNLAGEINEESKITDLEVMMEEEDTAQTDLPSILEKTVYQLGKDMPELYTELFEAIYEKNRESMIDALVPDEEKIYSLRIPGTGRMLLSLKTAEEEIKVINVRSQEKESYTWQQLEEAFRKIMHFENGPEESWEKQYKETFPGTEQKEPNTDKKKPKVEKAKKPKQKKSKPKVQEAVPEHQIPGQDSIENHTDYMPEPQKPEIAPAQPEFEPSPASITSLCYSCSHYSECNAKSGTVRECNEYINKAEIEKTEEQKYSEEQDRIDRETQKKLKDKAQEEKMSHLPSDTGQQVHKIRLASNYFEDVAAGVKTFELRKSDRHYRKGDILELMEFTEGRNTGRLIRAEVTYLLEDYTGLEDGYCIMAIKVIEVK